LFIHCSDDCRALFRRYKIDYVEAGLATGLYQLNEYLIRHKTLGFQSVWTEALKDKVYKPINWKSYHWALSEDLAHFVHDRPNMYVGYQEEKVKEEPLDLDLVW